jgi:MFS family permease
VDPGLGRVLVALIVGQICLHSCMTGVRMAAPLQALRQGHEAWAVGVLMGLFAAAPILLALHAGRLADRIGYHRPLRIAVGLTVAGGLVALASGWIAPDWPASNFAVVCVAAMLTGAGAGAGQRCRAGARGGADRPRWLSAGLWRLDGAALAGALVGQAGAA